MGAALAHPGRSYALLGDLAFLHDQNGLVLGPYDERPDLAIVVVNNAGGGIFSLLPQAALPGPFERVFGTPHGIDFRSFAALHRCAYERVERAADLVPAVAAATGAGGVHLLEVRTDREANVAHHQRAWEAVAAALGS